MNQRKPIQSPQPSNDEPILADVQSCWLTTAEGIRRCNPNLALERIEADARWLVELLVFLRIGCARQLLPAETWDGLDPQDPSERHLAELARLLEGRLGRELVWVESADKSRFTHPKPSDTRIDGGKLSLVFKRLVEKDFARRVSNAPVEVLGSIHQHLLGKRLRCTPKGEYRIQTAPARKKAAGIFYTPDCVVRYIVANVLERTFEHQRPLGAAFDGRLLDPACGCGWFLLSAYRLLAAGLGQPANGSSASALAKRLVGVDLDSGAVLAARRSLWLEIVPGRDQPERRAVAAVLADNIRSGNALTGPILDGQAGQFAAVIGNPPYHRERNSKALLAPIGATEFGRRWREPRMDLWYYFVHRGLELLEPGGRLAFIVGSYWTAGAGARKLIETLREAAHLDEIFSLDGLTVFPGVSGRHMILTLTKGGGSSSTLIKTPSPGGSDRAELLLSGRAPLIVFRKTHQQLFRDGRVDLQPPADGMLRRMSSFPRLEELGNVRQGIAENPARITRRAIRLHRGPWKLGEGVFALTAEELARLDLSEPERELIRPYHQLCDLGRYYLADAPAGVLVYSTSRTCPELGRFPALREHLARFRPIMDARRETRRGARPWWQLHWPREARLWESPKLIAPQMARRPSFVAALRPAYVPFSTNVFVPHADTVEDLNYFAAVLNSRLLWKWYRHHAKRRGIGIDLAGHAIRRTPMRRIDFSDPADTAKHDRLVELAGRLAGLSRLIRKLDSQEAARLKADSEQAEREIDSLVFDLYGVDEGEIGG